MRVSEKGEEVPLEKVRLVVCLSFCSLRYLHRVAPTAPWRKRKMLLVAVMACGVVLATIWPVVSESDGGITARLP